MTTASCGRYSKVLSVISVPFFVWSGVFLFGHKPINAIEEVVASAFQLGFAAAIGILYPYIISLTERRNYRLKGIVFGLTVCFGFYAAARLFKLPELTNIPVSSVVANYVNSAIYGWIIAEVSHYLSRKAVALEDAGG